MRNIHLDTSSLRRGQGIELLESRIAPATFFVGNVDGNDSEYREGVGYGQPGTDADPTFQTPFVSAEANPTDPIVQVIGATPGLYYLKLTTGDKLFLFSPGGGYANFITGPNGTGVKGTMIAVFQDLNGDYEVQADELVGLALGNNVSVQVSGSVAGDVIANYNDATGRLGAADEAPGNARALLNNSIKFFGATSVNGTIAAGGDIKSLRLTNNVDQILTGTAVNTGGMGGAALTYDINGSAPSPVVDGTTLSTVVMPIGKRGPNISNVTVGDLTKMQAGDGGAQAAGGSISGVTIVADASGWIIQAGAGGAGVTEAPKGGAGGKVKGVLANGLDETQSDGSPNSPGGMQVLGGAGGNALAGTNAVGGKGGDVTGVAIGYEKSRGSIERSVNAMRDAVLIKAGDGGLGRIGGAGGSISNDRVFAEPTAPGNDIVLQAGTGGLSIVSGGKAGAGGSIKGANVLAPDLFGGRVFLMAGDGGATGGISAGGNGGSITNSNVIAYAMTVSAGDGSLGATGGNGGSVSKLLAAEGFLTVRARQVVIDAGSGGNGLVGKGGAGGSVSNINVRNGDLSQLEINQGALAGDGGNSKSGAGGRGGSVSNILVSELELETANDVTMRIRAGNGGMGGDLAGVGGSGGAGGSISGKNVIIGLGASLVLEAGDGGNAPVKGAGGAGGGITNLAFISAGQTSGVNGSAALTAGSGGIAVGNGAGGKGGALKTIELVADGSIVAIAGTGGAGGATGGSGAGGAVTTAAFVSQFGSAEVYAGSAGSGGAKKGVGGGIKNVNMLAETVVNVIAGTGFAGGAGGSISGIGVTNADQDGGPTASISIIAGSGSGLGNVVGVGGAITNVSGFIAGGGLTVLQAGDGGGTLTKSANGGSIKDVNFLGGGGIGAELQIRAGSAPNAPNAAKGGNGGSVDGVGIGLNPNSIGGAFSIATGTVIRHIAAGNGGNADPLGGRGGQGGTVNEVRVNYDIGVRSGEGFGFNTMGGVFAGSGGTGTSFGRAGNVTNVSADGIASIVAGRPETGDAFFERNMANEVRNVVLNGSSAATTRGDGSYRNFTAADPGSGLGKANVLGGVVNPAAAGANVFDASKFVDNDSNGVFSTGDGITALTDGFVAAHKFIEAKGIFSVRPEAVLTDDPLTGIIAFIDLNNTNGQKVILP